MAFRKILPVFFTILYAMFLANVAFADHLTVYHPAPEIIPGFFHTGNFTFPQNLTIIGNLSANGFRLPANAVEDYVLTSDGSGYGKWKVLPSGFASGWTDDGPVVRLTNDNDKVGIGTASPDGLLHIYSISDPFFFIQRAGANPRNFRFSIEGTTPRLNIQDVTAGADRFVIDSNGNIGIGTTKPSNKLTIVGLTDTHVLNVSDGVRHFGVYAGALSNGGSGISIGSITNNQLRLFTNNQDRITITADGKVGIGTASPNAKLQVLDGAVWFNGTTGSTPTSGAGTRMMWIPAKAAFRAGSVSGTQWDNANIGLNSTAFGYNTIASGQYSTAMGVSTTASGGYSTTFGYNTIASGLASTAMGVGTIASGYGSTAMGGGTTASGQYSTAMGGSTTASGAASTAMGLFTAASGYTSTAMGFGTTASGQYSTAMGGSTTASGAASTAMGLFTAASGYTSTAMGNYVTAGSAANTIVLGMGVDNTNRLVNNIAQSLMVGFNSNVSTLFVGPSSGVGTTGNVGIGTTDPKKKLDVMGSIYLNENGAKIIMKADDGTCHSCGPGAAPVYAWTCSQVTCP